MLIMVIIVSIIPKMAFAVEGKTNNNSIGDEISEGNYIITSSLSNKAIEVANYGANNGDLIQQWTYGGGMQQQWMIQDNGDGFYKIVSKISGKVIEVKNSSSENGTKIVQNDYSGEDNQLWYFEKDKEGCYKIKSKLSDKCLDIEGISNGDGAKLQIWSDVNGDNQRWKLTKISDDIISGEEYIITSKKSNKLMEVENNGLENAALIQQWNYDIYFVSRP